MELTKEANENSKCSNNIHCLYPNLKIKAMLHFKNMWKNIIIFIPKYATIYKNCYRFIFPSC